MSNGTVNRDLTILRQQAKENIKRYIDERLPEEYGIKCNYKRSMEYCTPNRSMEYKREKIQALSLAKDCYSMKLDLLTDTTVVDDAIRFVSGKSKEKVESMESMDSGNEDDKESSEPDYDEDKDQLEEEQEEQTGEIATTNQVL